MTDTYSDKISRLKAHYITDKTLKKAQSKSILMNECPFCEFEWDCYQKDMHTFEARLCIRRSTETLRVWLYASDRKPKIKLGGMYGNLEVIKFDHKDKKGNLYFSCKCKCGKHIVARSSNLLNGNTTSCGCLRGKHNKMERSSGFKVSKCENSNNTTELSKTRGEFVKVGSNINLDHTRHIVATEHHSKVGCKVDTLIEVEDAEAPENTYYYYDDARCEFCGGLLRINSRAEQECEDCHTIA